MTTAVKDRLRSLRNEKGLSQGDVAKLIGVSRQAYVAYESGRVKPSQKLKELSKVFGVSVDYILGAEPEIKKDKLAYLEFDPRLFGNQDDHNREDDKPQDIELDEYLAQVKQDLLNGVERHDLKILGKPVDKETVQQIIDAMTIQLTLQKRRMQSRESSERKGK